jgi:hypothetical protein
MSPHPPIVTVSTRPAAPFEGSVVYRTDDRAFDFAPHVHSYEATSLLAGTLQLEIDVPTRRLLYVWGYSPAESWEDARLSMPIGEDLGVFVDDEVTLTQGVSRPLPGDWRPRWDKASRTFVAEQLDLEVDCYARIGQSCTIGLAGRQIGALWLSLSEPT